MGVVRTSPTWSMSQEALRDSVKHSGADAVRVELSGGNSAVHLSVSVRDAGVGFDPETADKRFSVTLCLHSPECRWQIRHQVDSVPTLCAEPAAMDRDESSRCLEWQHSRFVSRRPGRRSRMTCPSGSERRIQDGGARDRRPSSGSTSRSRLATIITPESEGAPTGLTCGP
jgi:hypothetical protein